MLAWARAYIDNIIILDKDNQRAHDLKLTTILFNLQNRGFAVHAKKSKIISDNLKFLCMHINENEIQLCVKEGTFDRLKKCKYWIARDIQRTIRILKWFRRFIPFYSTVIKPIQQPLK